jgi:hypothetical protein
MREPIGNEYFNESLYVYVICNLTYAGTIFDIVSPSIPVVGFTDDTTANKRLKPPSEEASAIQGLEKPAVHINEWMNGNKLKNE